MTYYRNRKIPDWWLDYLPDERNPYNKLDTLTLEKGCLTDYFHAHCSNKHPNTKGVECCNFVHQLIYIRFGGAFLTSPNGIHYGGHQGEVAYKEPNHITYKSAYLGDDNRIHIKDAKQYYEDVIHFIMAMLSEISKNHMSPGNYTASYWFFPSQTDQEIQKAKIEREKYHEAISKIKEDLKSQLEANEIHLDTISCDSAVFNAAYDICEGSWYSREFKFNNVHSNLDSKIMKVSIEARMPNLYYRYNQEKKNILLAKETLDITYDIRLYYTKGKYNTSLVIPKSSISNKVFQQVSNMCNKAMVDYNNSHISMDQYGHYPRNIFLDNNIGKLNLIYDTTVHPYPF